MDLRFYAGVSATYDNGLQPFAVDTKGNLVVAKGLYGEEASLGAYGVHSWEHARLGLDYRGGPALLEQELPERNRPAAGAGLQGPNLEAALVPDERRGRDIFPRPGSLGRLHHPQLRGRRSACGAALDDRAYLGEGGASVTYLLSAHTSVTAGGEGFTARYKSAGLVGMNGYSMRGSLNRRVSRHSNVGVLYEHLHFDYSNAFGQSDINTCEGVFESQLSRRWTLSLQAGAFQIQTQGLQHVPVDPVITALLGVTTTTATYNAQRVFPSGEVDLGIVPESDLTVSYVRLVAPDNGVYLASRQDSAWRRSITPARES